MNTKTQPVRWSAIVTSVLAVGGIAGLWTLPSTHITVLGTAADVLVPYILSGISLSYIWLKAEWLARRVVSGESGEILAHTAQDSPAATPEAKRRAAAVLNMPNVRR